MKLYHKDGITVQVINPADEDFYKRNGYKEAEPAQKTGSVKPTLEEKAALKEQKKAEKEALKARETFADTEQKEDGE